MTLAAAAPLADVQTSGRWGATGYVSDLGGPVHWLDFGGPSGDDAADPLVLVHGLGGSHLNWVLVGQALAADRRVVALDLPGFGLSPQGARRTTVQANAAVLGRFLREVVGRPAVLAGNSMGGMISILAAQRYAAHVAGLVLVDPALPLPLRRPDLQVAKEFLAFATPVVGELVLRADAAKRSPEEQVRRVVDLCYADPSRVDPEVLAAGVELVRQRAAYPAKEAAFLQAARSLMVLSSALRPAYRRAWRSVTAPTLLVHGEADRLVPIASARAIAADRPDWTTAFLPGVGHAPQLEVPDTFVATTRRWLDRPDRAVA